MIWKYNFVNHASSHSWFKNETLFGVLLELLSVLYVQKQAIEQRICNLHRSTTMLLINAQRKYIYRCHEHTTITA